MAEKTEDVHKDLDALKSDFSQLRSDMGELLSAVKEVGKDSVGAAADRSRQEMRQKLDQLSNAYDTARQSGADAYESVHHRLEEHPLTGVLVAFGVGFVVGNLMNRK